MRPEPESLVFRSKVDRWLVWLIGGLLVVPLIAAAWLAIPAGETASLAASAGIVLLVTVFIAWMFATTRYRVDAESLHVQSGPFRWHVALADIESVTDTRNPLSSPALSLDRLAIRYAGGKLLMVSPEDKAGFRAALNR